MDFGLISIWGSFHRWSYAGIILSVAQTVTLEWDALVHQWWESEAVTIGNQLKGVNDYRWKILKP